MVILLSILSVYLSSTAFGNAASVSQLARVGAQRGSHRICATRTTVNTSIVVCGKIYTGTGRLSIHNAR